MNIHDHDVYLDDAFMHQPNHLRVMRLMREMNYSPHPEHEVAETDSVIDSVSPELKPVEPPDLH